jgi:hypothetical protein
MVFAMYEGLMTVRHGITTRDAFFRRFAWSLYWAYLGLWPDRDEYGTMYLSGTLEGDKALTALAGGFFLILWANRGDLKFLQAAMGFPDPNRESGMCPCCEADGSAFNWRDFGSAVAMPVWHGTQWALRSMDAWRAAHPNCNELFRKLPTTTINNHIPDWMHVKNLGCDADFFGAVLVFVCYFMGFHGDPEAVLVMLWNKIDRWYRDHNTSCRFSTIKMSMFNPGLAKFPKLKGKAAEIRDVGRPLLHILRPFIDMTKREHRWMIEAIEYNVRMEDLYLEHIDKYRLPLASAKELFMCSLQFGRRVCALRRHFGDVHLLYRVTGKLHIITHSCFLSQYVHPRFGACWSGEDFMRVSQRLLQSCLNGVHPRKVVSKAMLRYSNAIWHSLVAQEEGRVLPML